MPLQYLSDSQGNHTAVLIPISEWLLIVQKHEDLKELDDSVISGEKKMKPSDFAGSMPGNIAANFYSYIEKSREDWN